MTDVCTTHKQTTPVWDSGFAWLRDAWARGEATRRERAIAIWCDDASPVRSSARPDLAYRMIRNAFDGRR
jgi:hypothetical protein